MKPLVVYYSKTGSNKYLAAKVARALKCDSEAITPRLDFFPYIILSSLTRISVGIKPLSHTVSGYDRVVVCGPIYMGLLISPLRDFINKYRNDIDKLYFITCCGSGEAEKDSKFGYNKIFQQVKKTAGDIHVHSEALPIGLVITENKKDDQNAVMNTRLSDTNFTGPIQTKFEHFIQKVSE